MPQFSVSATEHFVSLLTMSSARCKVTVGGVVVITC